MINQNRQKYAPLVKKISDEIGIDPALVAATIETESNWNPDAVNSIGATGMGQFMEGAAKDYGVQDRKNPEQSIRGVAKYLKSNMDRFGGKADFASAGYNAGPGAVQKYNGVPPYKETLTYVPKVMAARDRYKNFDWNNGQEQPPQSSLTNNEQPQQAQPQQQPPAQDQNQRESAIANMMRAAGLDPESQKKENRGNLLQDVMSNISAMAAGLRKDGGKGQQAILQGIEQRQQNRAEMKQGALSKMMQAFKEGQPQLTTNERDFAAVQKNPAYGQFLKDMKGNDPLDLIKTQLGIQAANLGIERDKLGIEKTKNELENDKNKPLSTESAKTMGVIFDGLDGISKLRGEIDSGNTLLGQSLPFGIGDRGTRAVVDNLSDVIGRLRSGGAINKDEESRFKGMLPGPLDDLDTKNKKISTLENYLNSVGVGLSGSPENFQKQIDKMRSPNKNQSAPKQQGTSIIKKAIEAVSGQQPQPAQPTQNQYSQMSDEELKKKLGLQ